MILKEDVCVCFCESFEKHLGGGGVGVASRPIDALLGSDLLTGGHLTKMG